MGGWKTEPWFLRLRGGNRIENEMKCFTLGGSLIPLLHENKYKTNEKK